MRYNEGSSLVLWFQLPLESYVYLNVISKRVRRGDSEKKTSTYSTVSRFCSFARKGAKCSDVMALRTSPSIEKLWLLFPLSYRESRVILRTVVTNEQTVVDEEEKDLISMSCLSKYLVALKYSFISENNRGSIRCRKVLETVQSSRRSLDGRWSKIEEMISRGMYNLAGIIELGYIDMLNFQIANCR